MIADYLSKIPPAINTKFIPPPLCVYPLTNPSLSSDPSSSTPDDILNTIDNLPPKIKDQIKTQAFEARSKRIIEVLNDYLKQNYNHFLAIYPGPDKP